MNLKTVVRRILLRIAAASLGAATALSFGFLVLDWWFPFPRHALMRQPAAAVLDKDGEPLRLFLPVDQRWRLPIRLEDANPQLVRALVASEDRWFYVHPGVNPLAVVRAAWANFKAGRVVSGASTIPMQIARMAEPSPRTVRAKLRETFRALQLVWRFERDEILEIYLNITPYGGNLEGVGAASYFYFGKRPSQLSLGEIALLTVLPRSPGRYDPFRFPERARQARDRALRQLEAQGAFSRREIADALAHPIPTQRRRTPFEAPHFSRQLVDLRPDQQRVPSTLDRRMQQTAEQQVRARIDELRRRGIENAAVVVVENRTRAVRALVGSADFFETAFGGQVNGALARRSPGSTLKPFLYAMAFDRGLIVPESMLLDVPTDFSGYVAENYDGRYRGQVTAADALKESLNASAVRLLAQTGLREFHELLKRGGLSTLQQPAIHYGLPLILGSGEVTLLDLTNLYATLAEGGLHKSVALQPRQPEAGKRLFSREAAHWATRILLDVRRPDLPDSWRLARQVPAVAWKTGTSYGHRDAWAMGFSDRLTVGVWVGNFTGRSQQGISGSLDAGPLLFDVFRALEGGARIATPQALEIGKIQLCAKSRQLPGPFCSDRLEVEYLPGRSHFEPCPYHRRIFVDRDTGHRLEGECLAMRPHRSEIVTVWPAELTAWRRAQGESVETLPPGSPACSGVLSGEGPRIISPDASTPYCRRGEAPLDFQKIALRVKSDPGARKLYWYQDGLLVASGRPDAPLFVPPLPGTHRLVVVDDTGRSDSLTYIVQ